MNSNEQIIEEDEIDLSELFATIKENFKTVLLITFLSILSAGVYLYWSKNIYSSNAIVSLEQKENNGLTMLKSSMLSSLGLGGISDNTDIGTAKVKLQSRKYIATLLNKLDIGMEYYIERNFKKIEFEKFNNFRIDLEIKDKELYGDEDEVEFRLKPINSKKYILEVRAINYKKEHSYGELVNNSYFRVKISKKEGIDPYDMEKEKDNPISDYIYSNFKYKIYIFKKLDRDAQIDKIIDNLSIDEIKEASNMFKLEYRGTMAKKAKEIVSQIAKSFISDTRRTREKELNRQLKIIDNQIANIRKNLNRRVKKLEKYQEKSGVAIMSDPALLLEDIDKKRQGIDTISLQIKEINNFINNLNSGDVLTSVALMGVGIDTTSIQPLMDSFISSNEKIRELELQKENINKSITSNKQIASFIEDLKNKNSMLENLLSDFTEDHPQVIKQKKEIERLIEKINNNIEINLKKFRKNRDITKSNILTNILMVKKSLLSKLKILEKDISKREKLLKSMPSKKITHDELKREWGFDQGIYSTLLQKRVEVEISKVSMKANTKILEDAYIAKKPDSPKKKLILIVSAVTGFILGIFFIFFREFINKKIRKLKDIADLTNMPILGEIKQGRYNRLSKEDFRMVRTNLQLSSIHQNGCNIILITSTINREGKTVISANLARIFSEINRKVLVIDLDMRKPRLHNEFKKKNSIGMSDYILQDIEISDILININQNLDFIPAGSIVSNESTLLMNNRFEKLIEELKEIYDYIIFDTPSLTPYSDTRLLFEYSDIVLFIVRADISFKNYITDFDRLKETHKIKSSGVILNGVEK